MLRWLSPEPTAICSGRRSSTRPATIRPHWRNLQRATCLRMWLLRFCCSKPRPSTHWEITARPSSTSKHWPRHIPQAPRLCRPFLGQLTAYMPKAVIKKLWRPTMPCRSNASPPPRPPESAITAASAHISAATPTLQADILPKQLPRRLPARPQTFIRVSSLLKKATMPKPATTSISPTKVPSRVGALHIILLKSTSCKGNGQRHSRRLVRYCGHVRPTNGLKCSAWPVNR